MEVHEGRKKYIYKTEIKNCKAKAKKKKKKKKKNKKRTQNF